MFDDDREASTDKTLRLISSKIKHEISIIQANLSQAVSIERLNGVKVVQEDGSIATMDQQLEYLQYCTHGLQHPIRPPNNPIYLDSLIEVRSLFPALRRARGRTSFRLWRLEGYLSESCIRAFSVSWPNSHVNTAGQRALFSSMLTKPFQS